ncbi:phosphodiester glycosidase family protein [Clostridium taeniosporum]|uniref:Exopolysaccharide biosynthesis protein n=1 Tax=Clostridium taeniosporum TaxID=394958 RepID=A0A1D7XNZ7_9CLOT|nr:phosphodiester glycosidase family protein [Clostridium taeniosporum]AOR25061.1 exopolysaccharide biosynthesis protein [Clostridium taeniosporum]
MNTKKRKIVKKKDKNSKSKSKKQKKTLSNTILFLLFQFIFTAITFPILLLYGPFENVKTMYVGAAMTSMHHQYLAKWFLSDEEISKILKKSSCEVGDETTNIDEVKISKNKDDTIELYDITDNPKFKGHYLLVNDPKRIKIGVSSKLKTEGETTSEIAENNDAVAAINGGAFVDKTSVKWTGTGAYPNGIVISDGNTVWNSLDPDGKTELFGITKDGIMIVGKYSENELKKLGVQQALSFGPELIINGKKTNIIGGGGAGLAPRTAIGQKKDGTIILMVIEGRSIGSLGATYKEIQEIMYKLGAINAINLDGGKSTTMYYSGEIVNHVSNSMGERPIPTAVIVK